MCVGHCVGAGAEVAAACDLRIAGDDMKARWVGSLHGVPVGPARLAPLVGEALAKDLIFTSRVLGAEEALRAGFVRSVHAPTTRRSPPCRWPPSWPSAPTCGG